MKSSFFNTAKPNKTLVLSRFTQHNHASDLNGTAKKIAVLVFAISVFFGTSTLNAQTNANGPEMADLHLTTAKVDGKEPVKHEDLETELEMYPFNITVPNDPVIKNEAMFDYHNHSSSEKFIVGARFFADANTHYEGGRDMKDLLMYTELYYGFRMFQIGGEAGSVTGHEYLSIGPQFTTYDNQVFKRVSVIARVYPDYVLGYEFTTQEWNVTKKVKLSATGMGRLVLPSNQTVIQASAWVSIERFKGVFIGVEYEYNSAKSYNTFVYELNNELFLGLKFELH